MNKPKYEFFKITDEHMWWGWFAAGALTAIALQLLIRTGFITMIYGPISTGTLCAAGKCFV